ncbi:hypothetical protein [Comamonas sp. 17RB]|uniref:hypothetical protein n=1 Tax=Comamonas sp. 17RB TaxID=3047025 RepID=UPI0024B84B13|nr:hypothetical protein [Comamonas sp. 17RB]MDI9857106.1 hypothetical protein [Comamonas sp. 17RB]
MSLPFKVAGFQTNHPLVHPAPRTPFSSSKKPARKISGGRPEKAMAARYGLGQLPKMGVTLAIAVHRRAGAAAVQGRPSMHSMQ